jgi:putative flippase GtrA
MNWLIRWGKFNAVGAMGVVVQLAALAAISRLWPGHYLWATAAAIEITLVHNFVWHLRWTWCERRGRDQSGRERSLLEQSGRDSAAAQCWRFHLSNGLVSMLGNLALMRLLVKVVHLPVLGANAVAIVACSLLNFCVADLWAFAVQIRPLDA